MMFTAALTDQHPRLLLCSTQTKERFACSASHVKPPGLSSLGEHKWCDWPAEEPAVQGFRRTQSMTCHDPFPG